MNKAYEQIYHRLEDKNWWFKARQDFLSRYLARYAQKNSRILDIGCGGGGLIEYLRARGYSQIYGFDVSAEAVKFCAARGLTNIIQADAEQPLSYAEKTFDVIIISDVFEHLSKTDIALCEWRRILKDNGELLIFVPAFMFLWGSHDELNHHVRRYTRKTLSLLVAKNGFSLRQGSYWNFLFFLPYVLLVRLNLSKFLYIEHDEMSEKYSILNPFLKFMLSLENRLIVSGWKQPFGVSFFGAFTKQ